MSNILQDLGKKIKENPKPAIYTVLGFVVLYGGYRLFKTIKDATDTSVDDEIVGTGGTTAGATISNQQALNYAQQLLDAMNYGRDSWFMSGTDDAKVLSVFKLLQNSADFIKVYNAFGIKDYDGYESPPDKGIWNWATTYEKRNLVYWLQSELEDSEGDEVYAIVKNRVESAGFVF
jgi:hypothetical protein